MIKIESNQECLEILQDLLDHGWKLEDEIDELAIEYAIDMLKRAERAKELLQLGSSALEKMALTALRGKADDKN